MVKQLSFLLALLGLITSLSEAQQNNISVSAFGEIHYNDIIFEKNNNHTPGNIDFHRFNIVAAYSYNERFSVQTELGVNHGLLNPETGGELTFKQAYIDVKLETIGIRTGLLTVPSGLTNQNRNPINFHGVERPNVEKYIIPTTWREMGAGIYGDTHFGLDFEAYLMAGLNPEKINGRNGIRDARQNGYYSSTANAAFSSRVGYKINQHMSVGASYYISTLKNRIENGNSEPVPALKGAFFNMGEGHIQYRRNRFQARGLFALSRILDVEDLNRTFDNAAGQIQSGGYIELAYDVLPLFEPATDQQFFVFARGESFDTNFTTGNIPRNNDFLREELTFGVTYKPIPDIVFKMDYQFFRTLGDRYEEKLNVGLVYNVNF